MNKVLYTLVAASLAIPLSATATDSNYRLINQGERVIQDGWNEDTGKFDQKIIVNNSVPDIRIVNMPGFASDANNCINQSSDDIRSRISNGDLGEIANKNKCGWEDEPIERQWIFKPGSGIVDAKRVVLRIRFDQTFQSSANIRFEGYGEGASVWSYNCHQTNSPYANQCKFPTGTDSVYINFTAAAGDIDEVRISGDGGEFSSGDANIENIEICASPNSNGSNGIKSGLTDKGNYTDEYTLENVSCENW